MTRHYLDHASAAPLRPTALEAMLPFLRDHHADPGRLHAEGRVTRVALENAREQVGALIGARPREVVFTRGGTEAANAAAHGAIARAVERGGAPHVVLGAIEHSCVRESAERSAALEGGSVTVVGCDTDGVVDPAALADAVRADTALVALQVANHEVGSIQPVAEAVLAVHEAAERCGAEPLVLADAASAVGHIPVDLGALGVDLAVVSAHKFGGPKGAGAMFVRRGLRIPPLVLGGAQERARRAGLEDVPAMVGFGAAAAEVADTLGAEAARNAAQCDRIAADAITLAGVLRAGPTDAARRLPHLVCLTVEGVEAEPILLALDQRGIAVHSGSACSSEMLEPSPVLLAMGADADRSLRISVGWGTTDADAEAFGPAFADALSTLRALRG
ncbi:MAG: cysteine desulfurase family protein [Actinomycetes bacterium]